MERRGKGGVVPDTGYDAGAAGHQLESMRARLGPIDDASAGEFVERMRATIEELRMVEEELERQNDELAALRDALADEAARYRTLFETAPIAYVATDLQGIIVEANAATAELLDVEVRFLIGKPLQLYVEEPERQALGTHVDELGRTGASSRNLPIRMRRRDGVAFDALVRVTASERNVRWMLHDVTEERGAEQRLRELNRDLATRADEQAGEIAAVLEQLPIGVVIIDAKTRSGLRINRRAHEIFGDSVPLAAEDGIGTLDRRRLDGTPFPVDDWPVTRALDGEHVAAERIVLHLPDGRTPVVEIAATPLADRDGVVAAVVLTVYDVTERERLERADREFVSNAAHQIRTPITAIASAAAALQAGAKEQPDDRDRFLEHIEREVDRLARLGEALLTLARAERGEGTADISIVPLRDVLTALAVENEAVFGVPVTVECADDLGALTNRPLVEQALANVLQNATKYGDDVRVTARREDDLAIVEVTDAGPGIAPTVQARAFERFYRSNDDHGGFGLGLPIAAAAVAAGHGQLELESTEGEGTTVRIILTAASLVR